MHISSWSEERGWTTLMWSVNQTSVLSPSLRSIVFPINGMDFLKSYMSLSYFLCILLCVLLEGKPLATGRQYMCCNVIFILLQ